MRWLKRLGRLLALLTSDEQGANPAAVRELLVIQVPGDWHLPEAVAAARVRFPQAMITVLTGSWRERIRELWRRRREAPSALVLLSLHPLTVAMACVWFRCPCLLYNRWGGWFCVRRRTLHEALTLQPGADRPRRAARSLQQGGWPTRLAQPLVAPLQLCALIGYLSGTLLKLFWRRWRFQRAQRTAQPPDAPCHAAPS